MSAAGAVYRGVSLMFEPFARLALRAGAPEEPPELHAERLARVPLSPVRTWWHAASLGEVAALEPVLERAVAAGLAGEFAVTVNTVTGRRAARKSWGDRARLAPLDLPGAVRRTFEAGRPRGLVLVETELWPNWLREAHTRGVKVGIVNGRLSDRSLPRYRRLRPLFRPLLAQVAAVAARTEADAARFRELGVPTDAVGVTGNTKHDRLEAPPPARLPWSSATVWTMGSLRPGEEGVVLDAFGALRPEHPGLRLVLGLRHPEAWPELDGNLRGRGLRFARRSRPGAGDAEAEVLVLDTHGEQGAVYAASRIVFVGGTLVPVGGHNLVEAALTGAAVLFGPHTAGVAEEADALLQGGGARRVADANELAETLRSWLERPEACERVGARALDVARGLRGASERTIAWLRERRVLEGNDE